MTATWPNDNPLFLKKLSGNIRVCQAVEEAFEHLMHGSMPNPPYDTVVARLQKRPFWDQTGACKAPSKPSAAHYRVSLPCLRAAEPSFVPSN